MNQEKIGKFIKEIRKKNNLTQKELAEKYGVTYQAVSKWENGKSIPDISLLKEISTDFNISIDELLSAKNKKKHIKPLFILIIILILVILIISIIFLNNDKNFEFKTISTTCRKFNISGSIAYNQKKSSIYISNINYCGGTDNNNYKKIECTLYETNNKVDTKISSFVYNEKKEIKLEDFLSKVKFHVDNYERTCKIYTNKSLYLMINATLDNEEIISYKVPLQINDTCNN